VIDAFLPVLHELEFFITFIVLVPHVNFQGPKQVKVSRDQVQTIRRIERHFPAKLFSVP
jgi:hypothetical protein